MVALAIAICTIVAAPWVVAFAARRSIAENHVKTGLHFRGERRMVEAEMEFTRAIALNPREYLTYFHRALVRRSLGDLTGGAADLAVTLSMSPDFGLAHDRLARVFAELGFIDLAGAHRRAALRLLPALGAGL